MGMDWLKKVRPGERMQIPAEAYNAFVDAARANKVQVTGSELTASVRQTAIVKVQNKTGDDLPRFSVLGIDVPIISATANLSEFQSRPNFQGITPVDPDHVGKFVILLEPLADDAIGDAVLAGAVAVQLTVTNADDTFAEIADGVTITLTTGTTGSAQILWKESPLVTSAVEASPAPSATEFAGGAALSAVDDFYVGRTLTFTSGTYSGQSVTVTEYDGASNTFTVAPALGGAPSAGNAFHLGIWAVVRLAGGKSNADGSFFAAIDAQAAYTTSAGLKPCSAYEVAAITDGAFATVVDGVTGHVGASSASAFQEFYDIAGDTIPAGTIVRAWPGKVVTKTGTVSGSPSPSATSFKSSGLGAVVNEYVGVSITFTSGALNGQSQKVTAYDGAGLFTTAAFAAAPTAGDTFTFPSQQYEFDSSAGLKGKLVTVRVSSLSLVSGRNPGFVQTVTVVAGGPDTRVDGAACVIEDPNGATLALGYYEARYIGTDSGTPVYETVAFLLTVRDSDNAVTVSKATKLTFANKTSDMTAGAVGFTVADAGSGEVAINVHTQYASASLDGIISGSNQVLGSGGDKTAPASFIVTNDLGVFGNGDVRGSLGVGTGSSSGGPSITILDGPLGNGEIAWDLGNPDPAYIRWPRVGSSLPDGRTMATGFEAFTVNSFGDCIGFFFSDSLRSMVLFGKALEFATPHYGVYEDHLGTGTQTLRQGTYATLLDGSKVYGGLICAAPTVTPTSDGTVP